MNYFFALQLPADIRQVVKETASEWQRIFEARASWYQADDYHITLRFLGDHDVTQETQLIDAVAPIAVSTSPFSVRLMPVGAFPNFYSPEVLWVGVQPSAELIDLATRINEAMINMNVKRERHPFRPHVTVARCRLVSQKYTKTEDGWEPKAWPTPDERLFADFTANSFTLLQTRSQKERQNGLNHRYTIVHTFPFGNPHSSTH